MLGLTLDFSESVTTYEEVTIMRAMRRGALVVMSLVLTFGCTTGRGAYEKPGNTEADRRRDVSECAQASIGHEPGRHMVSSPVLFDRAAFEQCLESRGYSRVR
jgi:hypothetical protein